MFLLTVLVYPVVLAAVCTGAGLLVDRCSGGFLPAALFPVLGAAALIAVSQLSTYIAPIAPATPYVMAAVAVAGLALGWERLRALARRWRAWSWQLAAPVLAYGLALAPVLLAGRPTFSSYLVLSDSAVHMLGADYLIRHGQDYAHLDLRNSYGQYINAYYNSNYPSGADTLYGGSSFLLGLPLIWSFQPFNAFILATATGPAWVLLRRIGLAGAWAVLGALVVTVPALVYGYELIGSIKEISSLPMILALGALVVLHPRWLRGPPRGVIPFALVAAAGVSALGAGFGVWVLAATVVLLAIAIADVLAGSQTTSRLLFLAAAGVAAVLVAALPTWVDLSGSLQVTQNIAASPAPGNLATPLHATQVFGAWLLDNYKHLPEGSDRVATYVLIAVTALACIAGAVHLVRKRELPLGGWLVLTLAVWLVAVLDATTWVDAKVLMLTSSLVVLLAWAGVAGLRASRLRAAAPLLALALAGGVLASDALQYHGSNLAPTARYQELARVNSKFAGKGPTLFTDFDEYSLYVLRDMDVGGPNFIYAPPAFAGSPGGYRDAVELERLPPADLLSYPLIVTRRDPAAARPPSSYRLLWEGAYYQVWGRRPGAQAAIADLKLAGSRADRCAEISRLAPLARANRAELIAAASPELIPISLAHASRPRGWRRDREGLAITTPGRLTASFRVPRAGGWDVWLQGQIMPAVGVALDGHRLGSIAGQLGGNSLAQNTMTPLRARLSAGVHRLSIRTGGSTLAPGGGGSMVLFAVFLTPAKGAGEQPLSAVPAGRWRSLCARSHEWVEVVRARMRPPSVVRAQPPAVSPSAPASRSSRAARASRRTSSAGWVASIVRIRPGSARASSS
jgi:hypothetical protein